MNESEWIWESALPTKLGLNRDEVRHLRNTLLTEAVHWRIEKNRVLISPAGMGLLEAHLNAHSSAPFAEPQEIVAPDVEDVAAGKNAPEIEDKEQFVDLVVWRAPMANLKIIEAYRPEKKPACHADVVRVRVKDGRRYSKFDNTGKPMVLQCRHLQADLYEHVGALPKRKGRI